MKNVAKGSIVAVLATLLLISILPAMMEDADAYILKKKLKEKLSKAKGKLTINKISQTQTIGVDVSANNGAIAIVSANAQQCAIIGGDGGSGGSGGDSGSGGSGGSGTSGIGGIGIGGSGGDSGSGGDGGSGGNSSSSCNIN